MPGLKMIFKLFRETFNEWNADNAPRLAAALAYYTAFSLAPLLIVVIAVVGVVFNADAAREEIMRQITRTAGQATAETISGLVESASHPAEGIVSTVLGVATLLLGAVGAFRQLQGALDTIWNVDNTKRKNGIVAFLKDNLLSFGMILVIGFLLLVSLVTATVLALFNDYLRTLMPGSDVLLSVFNILLSFGVTVFLFALMYKFLPHTRVEWRDVWIGALVTAILFSLGRFLLGLYLGNSGTASAYGAAGSFVIVLLWIYYSAQIVLFGAEFTQVYARSYGSHNNTPEGEAREEEKQKKVEEQQSEPVPS